MTAIIKGIFWGLKFWIPGLFWWLDLNRDFFGVIKTICRYVVVPAYPGCVIIYGTYWGLIFVPGKFRGFVGSPRDFFAF